ncbi:FAD binding domain-containing protein [Amycolatopsis taiwanensis]|uniref:FAD binding domain-containing protein n=1 Tax=Amycolatopsis taiwanensis TaxID=342230 RepID=UPI000A011937|nr:FAD binding domain-containing protein [Amycolatopsis taiwanensis]
MTPLPVPSRGNQDDHSAVPAEEQSTFRNPRTTAELAALDGDISLLAGGTDVLVQRRDGREFGTLVDLTGLSDAPPAVSHGGGVITLSALAPLTDISLGLGSALPGLRAAIGCFASAQIRNRATLGGNLANASPAADSVPPLVAASAVLTLRSGAGSRRVGVEEFLLGPGRTCLRRGEWIHTIDVPDEPGRQEGFRKIAGRRALAISVVSLAWAWTPTDSGLRDVRLAAGAVAPTVIRCPRTEAVLTGQLPTSELAITAAAVLREEISPIDDLRATADYRYAAIAGALVEALNGINGIAGFQIPEEI